LRVAGVTTLRQSVNYKAVTATKLVLIENMDNWSGGSMRFVLLISCKLWLNAVKNMIGHGIYKQKND
jgi:hypothetical protein